MQNFDFIIVGGGSAGCVLADKLSASGKHTVLLLEAGPSDKRFWLKVPIGYGISFYDPAVNWRFDGEVDAGLGNRKTYVPRGKTLGGSSSINALVYHRGQAGDYDDWAAAGNPGWDYASVKPVYEKFELVGTPDQTSQVKRGQTCLSVTDASASYHGLKQTFIDACGEGQMPSHSYPTMEGVGVGPYYITTRNGKRCSSATAFLDPAIKRPNLTVKTGVHVRRVETKDGRATAVHCDRGNQVEKYSVDREIILSAGAVGSPQILQLSGIGSGKLLRKNGIDVVLDQPNVGQHMQDHLGVNYNFQANRGTLNAVLGRWHGRFIAGGEYVLRRTGPLSLSVNQVGGLVKSSANLEWADTQLYLNPLSYSIVQDGKRAITKPDKYQGFIIGFNSCRPESRGSVEIQSSDSRKQPKIWGNYLSAQKDLDDVVKMARMIQRIQGTDALRAVLAKPGFIPLESMTDDDIVEDFRQRAGTVFHLCGTCRMGPNAETAVVNARLQVHGIAGVRVCDASIFPNITSANTNAPVIMVAHKAAEMILADNP